MTKFTFTFTKTRESLDWEDKSGYPCPDCGRLSHTIHQVINRKVDDLKIDEVLSVRMKCVASSCPRKTFTVHPEGVRFRSLRTVQSVLLTNTLYLSGLSYDKVNSFKGILNLSHGSKSTFWRDVQGLGKGIKRQKTFISGRERKPVVVAGQDGTYVKIKGKEVCLIVNADLSEQTGENRAFLSVEIAKTETAKAYRKSLANLARQGLDLSCLEVIVSDDSASSHKEVEQLNGFFWDEEKQTGKKIRRLNNHTVLHQVCLAHAKKNISKRLNRFLINHLKLNPDILKRRNRKQRPFHWINQIKTLSPPLRGIFNDLKAVVKSGFAPEYLGLIEKLAANKEVHQHQRLHKLIFDIWDKYHSYSLHHIRKDVPTTNNATERVNGRSKIRYKLCRGMKSKEGALNFFLTTQLFEAKKFQEMVQLVAT